MTSISDCKALGIISGGTRSSSKVCGDGAPLTS